MTVTPSKVESGKLITEFMLKMEKKRKKINLLISHQCFLLDMLEMACSL